MRDWFDPKYYRRFQGAVGLNHTLKEEAFEISGRKALREVFGESEDELTREEFEANRNELFLVHFGHYLGEIHRPPHDSRE